MLHLITPLLRPMRHFDLTQGERSIALAYFGVAVLGAALGINVVLTLGGVAAWITPFSAYDYWVVFSAAVGGCVGLYLGQDRLGHAGARGFGRAVFGMIWVSFVGALFGGTLALPFYGTMFGPFTLVVTLFKAPILALLWASSLLSAHFMIKVRRDERDSVLYAALSDSDDS